MATQKQIEANRRNAQKSTGPVTDLGKATAKFNALKHGMTASTAVLPYEDANSYAELRESFIATYRPANAVEASLVETIANSYWRLLRVRRVETAALDMGIRGLKKKYNASEKPLPPEDEDQTVAVVLNDDEDSLLKIERHQTRIERCYFQAIETLRKVQKDRLREERLTTAKPAEIGFVLQERPTLSFAPPRTRAAGACAASGHTQGPRVEAPHAEALPSITAMSESPRIPGRPNDFEE
jgi:hypothetical protein